MVFGSFEFNITVKAYLSKLKVDSNYESSSIVVAQVTMMLLSIERREGTKGGGKSLVRRTDTRG